MLGVVICSVIRSIPSGWKEKDKIICLKCYMKFGGEIESS